MATQAGKLFLKTSFKVAHSIESIYTGGKAVVTEDERYLITTCAEDVNVLDLQTGRTTLRLKGEADAITCFAVKPDGKHLVSASQSLLLKLWDLATGEEVRSWKAHEAPVITMDFDSTSTLVATGSADSTVKVWDVDRGYCTHNLKGHHGIISVVKFHPDKKNLRLVSGSDDCKIRVWDLNTRSCQAVLESHVSVVRGLDFSADGQFLISGGRDKVVNMWNLGSLSLEATLPIYESVESLGVVSASTPLPVEAGEHGSLLVYTGGDKGVVRLWDLRASNCILAQLPELNSKHEIVGTIYMRNSHTVAVLTSDQNILFYDLSKGLRRTRQIAGYNQEVLDLTLLGENDSHLAVITNTEQVRVYDNQTLDCDILYGHTEIVMCVDKSRDGNMLVSGSRDHKAIVWQFRPDAEAENRYKQIGVCVGHTEPVGAVAFPRKSSNFVITASHDRTIKLWDLPGAAQLEESTEPAKLKARYTFHAHDKDIQSIDVAPNDKVFASGALDKTAKLWSVEDGSLLGTFKGHRRGLWCVKFSPVDQILATCSTDKTIKLWSVTDFSCVKTFEGHLNSVLQVDFLSSGMQLVSSGSDGLVKLWTIRTNECVATLDNHEDRIWALAVKKDETAIISGSADSTIVVWEDVTLKEEEEKRQADAERILKEQDLSNFLLKRDYKNAILLAMQLDQPYRLLKLFGEVLDARKDSTSIMGSKSIDKIILELEDEELQKLLLYLRDWNTNSKHARTAQSVLHVILKFISMDRILELPKAKDILEALVAYTERHYQHANQLLTKSFIVDYTLHAMELLGPVGDEEEEEEDAAAEGLEDEDGMEGSEEVLGNGTDLLELAEAWTTGAGAGVEADGDGELKDQIDKEDVNGEGGDDDEDDDDDDEDEEEEDEEESEEDSDEDSDEREAVKANGKVATSDSDDDDDADDSDSDSGEGMEIDS
ncbi:Transducin (beta)-like 3 [Borealophlyctis nickersoniae]|nr:Transducin (beta)-like 3 [Borealophlyctis nickersoniae]